MFFSSWDIIFFVTSGFRESKAVLVGQISKKFELKHQRIKPTSILNSFGANSWKPVIMKDFLKRKGDFYYRNTIFSTWSFFAKIADREKLKFWD